MYLNFEQLELLSVFDTYKIGFISGATAEEMKDDGIPTPPYYFIFLFLI